MTSSIVLSREPIRNAKPYDMTITYVSGHKCSGIRVFHRMILGEHDSN
jgi:hypothetical protein